MVFKILTRPVQRKTIHVIEINDIIAVRRMTVMLRICCIVVFSFSADDMGLGKTLTMISLLMRHRELVSEGILTDDFSTQKEEQESGEEDGGGWFSKKAGKVYGLVLYYCYFFPSGNETSL